MDLLRGCSQSSKLGKKVLVRSKFLQLAIAKAKFDREGVSLSRTREHNRMQAFCKESFTPGAWKLAKAYGQVPVKGAGHRAPFTIPGYLARWFRFWITQKWEEKVEQGKMTSHHDRKYFFRADIFPVPIIQQVLTLSASTLGCS